MEGQKKGKWARRSPNEWRSLLAKCGDSGLGIKAFCRREAISAASFYRWRSVLSDGGGHDQGAATFVDLGTLTAGTLPRARLDLKLDFGDGLILHLVRS